MSTGRIEASALRSTLIWTRRAGPWCRRGPGDRTISRAHFNQKSKRGSLCQMWANGRCFCAFRRPVQLDILINLINSSGGAVDLPLRIDMARRQAAQIEAMITDLDCMAATLENEIKAEENRTAIRLP